MNEDDNKEKEVIKVNELITAFKSQYGDVIPIEEPTLSSVVEALANYKKNIQSKEASLSLLNEIKSLSSASSPSAIAKLEKKILNDEYLSNESSVVNYIKSLQSTSSKEISNEKKTLILFRNVIKFSYEETLTSTTVELSPIQLFKELNLDSDVSQIKYDKVEELEVEFLITTSFKIFISEFQKLIQEDSPQIGQILSLLINLYKHYFSKIETDSAQFPSMLLMHNNLELLKCLISHHILFNKELSSKHKFQSIFLYIKNFSYEILNQQITNLIEELTIAVEQIRTFEKISIESNLKKVQQMVNDTLDLMTKFFSLFKEFAIPSELVFNMNYVLSLYFDVLNRKILAVKDFSINDIQYILNIFQEIVPRIKKEIFVMCGDGDLNLKLMSIFEKNQKYKKFEEVLFVLNSNLREIKNFIINHNFNIHIDKNELIEMISSIFEKTDKRDELIDFIERKLSKEKDIM